METFKVRRREVPPPPREYLYLVDAGRGDYRVVDPVGDEPSNALSASAALALYEPLDPERRAELEKVAAERAETQASLDDRGAAEAPEEEPDHAA